MPSSHKHAYDLDLRGPELIPYRLHGRIRTTVPFTAERKAKYSKVQRLDFDYIENEIVLREERLETIHPNIRKEMRKWFLSMFIGVFTGLFAFLVLLAARYMNSLKLDLTRRELSPGKSPKEAFQLAYAFDVGCVFIATTLTSFVEPRSAGSGIAEVKAYLNGSRYVHILNLRTLVCKLVGIVLTVASGMLVGLQGPMVRRVRANPQRALKCTHSHSIHTRCTWAPASRRVSRAAARARCTAIRGVLLSSETHATSATSCQRELQPVSPLPLELRWAASCSRWKKPLAFGTSR